jgi:hypothetical protein
MTRRHSSFHPALRISSLALLALLGGARAEAQESWDAIYLGGAKIGYIHTFVQKVPNRGREYLRVRIDMEQRVKRRDDISVTKLMYGTIETLDGQVLRLDTRTQAGGNQDLRAHGDVIGGKMELILENGGQRRSLIIPWSPEIRGPYAAEQSMARQPMKEHETRSLKMFIPDLNKVSELTLQSRTIEPVLMGDGSKRPLLRVDLTNVIDGQPRPELESRAYADDQGQILKSEQDVMGGIVYYRTTKQAALAPGGLAKFDLILESVIKTGRKIPNPDQTRDIKYRLTLKDSEPVQVFPNDGRQTIQPDGTKGSAVLEVKSAGPLEGAATDEPDPKYLESNALVTSDDTQVRRLAKRATEGVVGPWEKATRINHWVYENMRQNANFKVAFAAANAVARNLSGDCTEHAVLAAAMCRAEGIPSRVAVGLIYVDSLEGFGYHMWHEVFVNHRWVALDASFDQSAVDAVHIKLSCTSLDGVSPFEAFLPLARVMGKLSIEPIELR